MELSLRRFAAAPERAELDAVEFLADSEAVSGAAGSGGGCLAATGL